MLQRCSHFTKRLQTAWSSNATWHVHKYRLIPYKLTHPVLQIQIYGSLVPSSCSSAVVAAPAACCRVHLTRKHSSTGIQCELSGQCAKLCTCGAASEICTPLNHGVERVRTHPAFFTWCKEVGFGQCVEDTASLIKTMNNDDIETPSPLIHGYDERSPAFCPQDRCFSHLTTDRLTTKLPGV
jgi:hypothetical protein